MWLNYDFVRGAGSIYLEDFSSDAAGDFQRRMQLKERNLDVVEYQGKHYLQSLDGGYEKFVVPDVLPDGFTAESHIVRPAPARALRASFDAWAQGFALSCRGKGGAIGAVAGYPSSEMRLDPPETLRPVESRHTAYGTRGHEYD